MSEITDVDTASAVNTTDPTDTGDKADTAGTPDTGGTPDTDDRPETAEGKYSGPYWIRPVSQMSDDEKKLAITDISALLVDLNRKIEAERTDFKSCDEVKEPGRAEWLKGQLQRHKRSRKGANERIKELREATEAASESV